MKNIGVIHVSVLLVVGFYLPSCSTEQQTTGMSQVSNNLVAVAAGYNPSSLDYALSRQANGGLQRNPCVGLTLFSCQPVLLKVYLAISKRMFSTVQEVVAGVTEKFDALPDGSEGADLEVGTDTTIDYRKTSGTEFVVLVKVSGEPAVHLDINANTYVLTADFSKMSDSRDPGGVVKSTVVYTDDTHWTTTVQITGMACQDEDARAPRGMEIRLSRNEDVWNVLAHMYLPAWMHGLTTGGSPTCSTAVTSANSLVMYTSAVGDSAAAKANVYFMTPSVSLSSIASYPLSAMCENYFSGVDCTSGNLATSAYANSYCNKADTIAAQWDNTCSAYSTAVSEATFPTDFKEPSVLASDSLSVPSSLSRSR